MAKPSDKSPELANFFQAFSGRTTAIENNKCINPPFGCGGDALEFRDKLSRKEFTISGLCQQCQDAIFADE